MPFLDWSRARVNPADRDVDAGRCRLDADEDVDALVAFLKNLGSQVTQ